MKSLRFTLVSEGSSDRALLPVIAWSILDHREDLRFVTQWADLRSLRSTPKDLGEKLKVAVELYPCDLLLVHRDSDRTTRAKRVDEIQRALDKVENPPAVCVIPVRMLEAWFLFDESAIRRVAGNPRGEAPLDLPAMARVEKIPDPKKLLHEALREASDSSGRRRRRLSRVKSPVRRIAELIEDFSPLRNLGAFADFERDLQARLDELLEFVP